MVNVPLLYWIKLYLDHSNYTKATSDNDLDLFIFVIYLWQ